MNRRISDADKGISQLKSIGLAAVTFFAVFVIVTAAYIAWAVRTSPESNSMAGLPAAVSGFIFASIAALAVFLISYRRFLRKFEDE
jgi:hypothetical protein